MLSTEPSRRMIVKIACYVFGDQRRRIFGPIFPAAQVPEFAGDASPLNALRISKH
jgi:hypothetical protein